MAISKLKFIQDKKTALTKQQRRQLADLLNQGKESSAKIRVENIIRDDIYIELLEFLELYCELLLARISIILDQSRTTCDPGLKEAVHSIIYSAPSTELKELTTIREMLVLKYGVEFGKIAMNNEDGAVPQKIVTRCQIEAPSETLVNLYLCEIAKAYQAPYSGMKDLEPSDEEDALDGETDDLDDKDDDEPSGGEALKIEPGVEEPILEKVSEVKQKKKGATSAPRTDQNDFDSLKARFAALKGGPK
ncbi:uncharacterized protein AC631_02879 [Debaryomyces fabryi]|uniref:Vacuolar protein sorting-associated protein IST1 n=1 Tax=Debaryomyces fabryi TaxID=58627 RepID=A0A0V1PYN4_9ASCO|nr:uncharacterized protein AC631_02879 [Debaryomyces fabryi]KSA01384.1 hypothetical protein AC631_02879 [Debaryomyces fabryi]